MSNTDYRLGQWFKELEKKEKELKAKKNDDLKPEVVSTPYIVQETAQNCAPQSVASSFAASLGNSEVGEAVPFNQHKIDGVGRVSVIDSEDDLYDNTDVPDIDDFISFDDTKNKAKESLYEDKTILANVIESENLSSITEGTGMPKPLEVSSTGVNEIKTQVREIEDLLKDADTVKDFEPDVDNIVKEIEKRPVVESVQSVEPALHADSDGSIQEKWDRMPHHLQVLFGTTDAEVAQRSYKKFKENRGVLIERLLDPSISLEETARILNVCPTTVRRYTNKGVLKHFRTAGNQRRFKLSDVLAFLESNNSNY